MSRPSSTVKAWLPGSPSVEVVDRLSSSRCQFPKTPRIAPTSPRRFISRFNGLKIRCEYGPGGAKPSRMGKYVLGRPAGQVEPGPVRQEPEAGRGKLAPALPGQHDVELVLQAVEVEHVGRRIGKLGVAEGVGAPVGRLLLLRHIDAEQFPCEVLEAVLVGVGAGKARGGPRAIHRCRHDAERIED